MPWRHETGSADRTIGPLVLSEYSIPMAFDRSFIGPGSLANLVPALWRQQVEDWPRLREALDGLRKVRTRSFRLGLSTVVVQYNPGREASSAAKVDAASLAARPCFLCKDNLPKSQCGIVYRKDWLILCNPAPIFEPHFTISSMTHQPQSVQVAAPVMLDLARDLDGHYTIFYNGPSSGASAPDHLHLQAAPVALLPHEKELVRNICCGRTAESPGWIDWVHCDPVRIGVSRPGHRSAIFLMSRSRDELLSALEWVLEVLAEVRPARPEPMLNLFVGYADNCWTVWLYPRAAHRPSFYGLGPDEFLISPGAVDVAGLLILPRGTDFERINEEIITRVYEEVLMSPGDLLRVRFKLAHSERVGGNGVRRSC